MSDYEAIYQEPTELSFGRPGVMVKVDLQTGDVELGYKVTPNEAALMFWREVQLVGHSLAMQVESLTRENAELREELKRVADTLVSWQERISHE